MLSREVTCQNGFARYDSGMGEQPVAKRHVKPWVAVVAIAGAAVIFGAVALVVGNKRLDRETHPESGLVVSRAAAPDGRKLPLA